MEIIIENIVGANRKIQARRLPPGVGTVCRNIRPPDGTGEARPWNLPVAVSPAPNIPSGRVTLYRMGRDSATASVHWLSWTSVVHAIRGFDVTDTTERTYWTDGSGPKWSDNIQALATAPYPTAYRPMSVPQPSAAPTVTLNTNGTTGDDQRVYYCHTWVNDIGWESAPSPPTLSPTHKPGATMDLAQVATVPSGNYGVNRIRWYRTQAISSTDAEFFFLREYAIGSSGMQDDARELGTDVLPTDASNMRIALSDSATCLTQCWNDFAAALVGKTVRFCEPTLIYAWPLSNQYTLEDTPIAQAAFAQRLLVLTTAGGHLFTGSDPEAMDRKPMALSPIVSVRSLVVAESWCAWAAMDGLHYFGVDGYRNLTASMLTQAQWEAMNPATMHCHYMQIGGRPLVVVFYNDGADKGLIVDPTNEFGFYELDTGYPAAYWDKLLRKLFVLDGSTLKEWDAGSPMTANFKSAVLRQPFSDDSGQWLELISSGTVNVKVYTESPAAPEGALVQRMSRDLTIGVWTLVEGAVGRDWQIEMTWTGSVQGISIT